jgi:hypothetical protein
VRGLFQHHVRKTTLCQPITGGQPGLSRAYDQRPYTLNHPVTSGNQAAVLSSQAELGYAPTTQKPERSPSSSEAMKACASRRTVPPGLHDRTLGG